MNQSNHNSFSYSNPNQAVYKEIDDKFDKISPNNPFLQFMKRKLRKDDYRGVHFSQHNRLTLDKIETVLQTIYDSVKTGELTIHAGDFKKGQYKEEAKTYYEVIEKIRKKINQGTIMSIQKNIFVDLARIGFIQRLKKDGTLINEEYEGRKYAKHIKLTDKAIKLLNAGYKRTEVYTAIANKFLDDRLKEIINTLYNSEIYATEAIDIEELMYILLDNNLKPQEKIDMLDAYRSLSKVQRKKVTKVLKETLKPDNFMGDKKAKRDYNNWKNEAQQIMTIANDTVYFSCHNNKLALGGTSSTKIVNSPDIPRRKAKVRKDYYENHNIQKIEGSELHHIIPVGEAKNKKEMDKIDVYENVVSLTKQKHEEIPRVNNSYISLSLDKEQGALVSVLNKNDSIQIKNGKNAFYAENQVSKMTRKNEELLKMLGYI